MVNPVTEDDEYGDASADPVPSFSVPGLAGMLGGSVTQKVRPLLYLARSSTEACSGAVSSERPGVAVHVSDASGVRCAWMGTTTVFGKIIRKYDEVDDKTLRSLVLGTLNAGEQDVWLSGNDPEVAADLADLARDESFKVVRVNGEMPPSVSDPFSLFDNTRDMHVPEGQTHVSSFCKIDTRTSAPVEKGAVLRMGVYSVPPGETDILYVDADGVPVGMHGRLPYVAESWLAEMLADVEAKVEYVSWGREVRDGEEVEIQTALFEIPVDVARVLQDAKLPPGMRGSGV